MNNNPFGTILNTPISGFSISEKLGIYIANHFIIGFEHCYDRGSYCILMYTPNQNHIIYTHTDSDLKFKDVANKIITKIIESLRYNASSNINIDKIIKEVVNNGEETINVNE